MLTDDIEEYKEEFKEFKNLMEEIYKLDADCVPLKKEITKLKKSLQEKLQAQKKTEKLQEKKKNSKKRKRGPGRPPKQGPRKKRKLDPDLKKIFSKMQEKHEEHIGISKQRLNYAKEVNKVVQESIENLDKKLFEVTREIRRTVHNNKTRLPKPTSYEVLESLLQSEIHLSKMKQQYKDFSFLEKQDVVIHLRSLGRGEEPEIEMWQRKVKQDLTMSLPEDDLTFRDVKRIRKPLVRNNHDRKTWCFCNQKSSGQMIGCDNENCEIEWFHFVCVGLKVKPAGPWLCARCKSKGVKPRIRGSKGKKSSDRGVT